MEEPPPMPELSGGGGNAPPLSGLYLFIAPTREATATRHAFVRGWLGPEVARLLPHEYVGTAEAPPAKGSPQARYLVITPPSPRARRRSGAPRSSSCAPSWCCTSCTPSCASGARSSSP